MTGEYSECGGAVSGMQKECGDEIDNMTDLVCSESSSRAESATVSCHFYLAMS